LSKIIWNNGLNSKEAFDESAATSSSVRLSGARRVKENDIQEYRIDPGNSDEGGDQPESPCQRQLSTRRVWLRELRPSVFACERNETDIQSSFRLGQPGNRRLKLARGMIDQNGTRAKAQTCTFFCASFISTVAIHAS
jgi:hypothetical protein